MKSFAPTFNLSVLNLSLKSGIWVGVTAVSLASAAVTVVNNWELIRKEVEGFYEVTIKTYVMGSVFKTTEFMKKNMIAGYPILYRKVKGWYNDISPSRWREWMENNLTLEKFKIAYSFLFKKSRGYIGKSFTALMKGSSGLLNEEYIKAAIVMLVAAVEFVVNLLKSLGTADQQFKKIFELIKLWISDSNFFSVVSEFASVLHNYPEIIKHLNMNDIQLALKYSIGKNFKDFLKNSEKLRKNPIKNLKGMDLKNEVMKRLFSDYECRLLNGDSRFSTALCVIKKDTEETLKNSSYCPDGGCNAEKIISESLESTIKDASNAIGKFFSNNREGIKSALNGLFSHITNAFISSFNTSSTSGGTGGLET